MSRPLYIFDIDGTLSLPDHRRHLVECPACPQCDGKSTVYQFGANLTCNVCNGTGKQPWFIPDWKGFYDACGRDKPNKPVIEVMNRLHKSSDIWFFTGRTDRVRVLTEHWLWLYTKLGMKSVKNGQVVMRRDGDWRADDVIKQEMLDAMLPEDRARLVAVFDDRARVVAMWRRNGIPCFQVAEGNF